MDAYSENTRPLEGRYRYWPGSTRTIPRHSPRHQFPRSRAQNITSMVCVLYRKLFKNRPYRIETKNSLHLLNTIRTSIMAYRTTFTDHKDTYQAALVSLFSGKPEDTEGDLSKLLAPSFTLRDQDGTRDFAAFVSHMRWLRQNVPRVTLTITQFLRDGPQVADRHVGITTLEDGTVLKSETFMFGVVAEDGRLVSLVETVNQIKD